VAATITLIRWAPAKKTVQPPTNAVVAAASCARPDDGLGPVSPSGTTQLPPSSRPHHYPSKEKSRDKALTSVSRVRKAKDFYLEAKLVSLRRTDRVIEVFRGRVSWRVDAFTNRQIPSRSRYLSRRYAI
jgi:hypothetical protein